VAAALQAVFRPHLRDDRLHSVPAKGYTNLQLYWSDRLVNSRQAGNLLKERTWLNPAVLTAKTMGVSSIRQPRYIIVATYGLRIDERPDEVVKALVWQPQIVEEAAKEQTWIIDVQQADTLTAVSAIHNFCADAVMSRLGIQEFEFGSWSYSVVPVRSEISSKAQRRDSIVLRHHSLEGATILLELADITSTVRSYLIQVLTVHDFFVGRTDMFDVPEDT